MWLFVISLEEAMQHCGWKEEKDEEGDRGESLMLIQASRAFMQDQIGIMQ